MTRLLAAGLVFGALIGPAAAADLPVKAPTPVSTWDGWYLGGSIGWERNDSNWTTTCLADPFNGFPCGPTDPYFADASSPHTFTTSGPRIGGYFGVNWQVAPTWVVGVESDFGFFDRTSTVRGIVGCTIFCGGFSGPGVTTAFDSTSVTTKWDASLRARVGYLVTPDVLLYGTGGFAVQSSDANVTCAGAGSFFGFIVAPPISPWCEDSHNQTFANHIQNGWTVGGGLEWKATANWILRGEYRYSDFGTWTPVFNQSTPDEIHASITTHTQMVTFGVSYLFGGTSAVVAKY